MRYFRLLFDSGARNMWFLDEPVSKDGKPIDAREFIHGRPYTGPTPYRVPIDQPGVRTEVTLAAFDMPVISQRVGKILDQFPRASVERFPVLVGSIGPGYEILNVMVTADCLDEKCSEITRFAASDGRPEKVGQYLMVTNLTINPDRTDGQDIFRIRGWEIALIVSEEIKRSIEGMPNLGVVFDPVC